MSIVNWLVAHWSLVMNVAVILLAVGVGYARGKLNEVLAEIVALVLSVSKREIQEIDIGLVYSGALHLYQYLPAFVKAFVTDQMFATWVAEVFWPRIVAMCTAERAAFLRSAKAKCIPIDE